VGKSLKVFSSPYEMAEKFAEDLVRRVNDSAKRKKSLTVALSGGSTPELLFSILGDHFSKSAHWEYVHFFWGDERCVPPDSPDSNYGTTWSKFLSKIIIPHENIHRLKGENDPVNEAKRYSGEISDLTLKRDGLPVFDMVMLGLGEDGHTASIFPENIGLLNSINICEVSVHPKSLQKRITITGRVINNADSITFLVTGRKKADIVANIFNKSKEALNYPAAYIVPIYGELSWLIDTDAVSLIKEHNDHML